MLEVISFPCLKLLTVHFITECFFQQDLVTDLFSEWSLPSLLNWYIFISSWIFEGRKINQYQWWRENVQYVPLVLSFTWSISFIELFLSVTLTIGSFNVQLVFHKSFFKVSLIVSHSWRKYWCLVLQSFRVFSLW